MTIEPDELERLTDQASLGLLGFDRRPLVISANATAHQLLERRPGTLLGRSPMEVFLDHHLDGVVRAAVGGEPGTRELGSGDRRRTLARALPSATGAWVTLEDVSELRRLQRIRAEFIDNLSHEIRTPLTTVRLLTELLIEDLAGTDVPPRVRERVATIDVETGHLVQMVTELLDLSRIEQAAAVLRSDVVGSGPIVVNATARLRTFADRQGVTLVVDIPDQLPNVRGDEERLGQLLVNLLHNAVKFSSERDTVTVSAAADDTEVVISVADHGIGIAVADQARIFERFYKVDRARARAMGGTGLGLAIARHIAEAHGGRLWVESREGEGSTFRLALPLA